MTESFYEVLGVDPDADDESIRRAYRQRLKETHPDVSDAPDADVRTQRLLDAKETLLDPVERRRYDRISHGAYVGVADDTLDSSATRAAREAGWGPETGDGHSEESEPSSSARSTDDRADPRERRARERRARERVDTEADWTADGESAGTDGDAGSTGRRTASSWATSMSDRRVDPTVDPTARQHGGPRTPWISIEESPATVTATFGLYPLLVAGAVFPAFPVYVNLAVAACTIVLIAAMQSTPGVGVVVFATWSVIGSIGLAVAGIHPISLLGLLVLGSTWFPLGLTLLTYVALRA